LSNLLSRLEAAMRVISRNPRTAAEVVPLFEDFVASLEEIVNDLEVSPDEQVAVNLRRIKEAVK
jgi:hypothetical protein